MISAGLVREPIDVPRLIALAGTDDAGATAVFIGTVRNENDGRRVNGMEYSAYEAMAAKELTRIAHEAAEIFNVISLAIEHRIGALKLGEASVAIVAASAHRRAAIDCTSFVIEEIKKRVPIWKLEHYADGTREWVDPAASPTGVVL